MKTLLIVFHSLTGGALLDGEAAANGAASEPEIRVRLLKAQDASPADVLEAQVTCLRLRKISERCLE